MNGLARWGSLPVACHAFLEQDQVCRRGADSPRSERVRVPRVLSRWGSARQHGRPGSVVSPVSGRVRSSSPKGPANIKPGRQAHRKRNTRLEVGTGSCQVLSLRIPHRGPARQDRSSRRTRGRSGPPRKGAGASALKVSRQRTSQDFGAQAGAPAERAARAAFEVNLIRHVTAKPTGCDDVSRKVRGPDTDGARPVGVEDRNAHS